MEEKTKPFFRRRKMRKLILGIFVMTMVFGFTGCIKDSSDEPSNLTEAVEPEWHEGNWYIDWIYGDYNDTSRIFFSLEEARAANVSEENLVYRSCFYLDNPEFSECLKAEMYNLEDGKLIASEGKHALGGDLSQGGAIMRNRAIIVPVTPWKVSFTNNDQPPFDRKMIYYFDDGTTLTYYYHKL